MTATYKQLNLQVIENQLDKAMQLFHTLRAYSGVILIGGPGGGKTTLHYALSKMLSNPETNRHGFCVSQSYSVRTILIITAIYTCR